MQHHTHTRTHTTLILPFYWHCGNKRLKKLLIHNSHPSCNLSIHIQIGVEASFVMRWTLPTIECLVIRETSWLETKVKWKCIRRTLSLLHLSNECCRYFWWLILLVGNSNNNETTNSSIFVAYTAMDVQLGWFKPCLRV